MVGINTNNISKEFVDSMILGSAMGDGYVSKSDSRHKSIQVTHNGTKEYKYTEFMQKSIGLYYKVLPIRMAHNNTVTFRISETEEELFNYIRNNTRYIKNNARKIPDMNLINPIVMLFWYLDDGSLGICEQKRPNGRKPSISRRLKITLVSYKDVDILKFIKLFNKKYNIEFKPLYNKGKIHDIGLKKLEDIIKFMDLIKSYLYLIPKEMHYKFCVCYHKTVIFKEDTYNDYNMCDYHNTGICTCRNKDMRHLYTNLRN